VGCYVIASLGALVVLGAGNLLTAISVAHQGARSGVAQVIVTPDRGRPAARRATGPGAPMRVSQDRRAAAHPMHVREAGRASRRSAAIGCPQCSHTP
jgi:hypothetical protein